MSRKEATILNLREKTARGEPIVMVTTCDYPSALAADRMTFVVISPSNEVCEGFKPLTRTRR